MQQSGWLLLAAGFDGATPLYFDPRSGAKIQIETHIDHHKKGLLQNWRFAAVLFFELSVPLSGTGSMLRQ